MIKSSKKLKTIGLVLGSVLLAWMGGTPLAWGQGKTRVRLESGGTPELRRAAEKSASAVITEINRAVVFDDRPDLSNAPITDQGRKSILSRWSQAPFYCNPTDLTRSLVQTGSGIYEIQDIPLIVGGEQRSGILSLTAEGQVRGFRYSDESVTGSITIASEPPGASVLVNGDSIGTAPLTEKLTPGEYSVQLRREGYLTAERTVTVEKGQSAQISVALRRPLRVRLASQRDNEITNVRFERDGQELVVRYDLAGEEDEYEVSLRLSTDGGQTFQELRGTVEGAVGGDVKPGSGKQITWAALRDYPEGLSGTRYRLQVQAQPEGGNGWLYAIGGTVLVGGGATVAAFLTGLIGGGDDGYPRPPAPPGN